MKKYFLTLTLMAATALGSFSLRAQTATNAMAAATNAMAAAAPAAPAPTNAPSMEQRLESIEAYFQNGDPTATYKDTNGDWTVYFTNGPSIINMNLANSTRRQRVLSRRGS